MMAEGALNENASAPVRGWKPSLGEIASLPLPGLMLLDRGLLRVAGFLMQGKLAGITGLHHVAADRDPFILALNHSSRLDAMVVPLFLMLARGGRRIHFLADWNFRLIPGVGLLYARAGAITVARKQAKPRFLTPLRALYRGKVPPMEQARWLLLRGRSVGIFPEGTVNRDGNRLMRGRLGVARLSLETGVPVVPAGILLHGEDSRSPVALSIEIGAPLMPPPVALAGREIVGSWHTRIMRAISLCCGKTYQFNPEEKRRDQLPSHTQPTC
jgi:1-acyl-sn-glycerol-3-phosphate acyltransferase